MTAITLNTILIVLLQAFKYGNIKNFVVPNESSELSPIYSKICAELYVIKGGVS